MKQQSTLFDFYSRGGKKNKNNDESKLDANETFSTSTTKVSKHQSSGYNSQWRLEFPWHATVSDNDIITGKLFLKIIQLAN